MSTQTKRGILEAAVIKYGSQTWAFKKNVGGFV